MKSLDQVLDEVTLTYRSDYDALVGWPQGLADALDWACESGTCNGEGESEDDPQDGEYHGWAKWERVEQSKCGGRDLYIECGYCGAEYRYDDTGNLLEVF